MDVCVTPSLHHQHLHHSHHHHHTGAILLILVLLIGTPQTGLSEEEGTKLLRGQQEKKLLQREEHQQGGLHQQKQHQEQQEEEGPQQRQREEKREEGKQVKVFSLQKGLWTEPADDVFIRHRLWQQHHHPPLLRVFTVCYWIRLDKFIIFIPHLSYATSESDNELLIYSIDDKIGTYLKGEHQSHHTHASSFYPDTWTHLCHAFGNTTYTVYWQGQVLARDQLLGYPGLELNGTLVLGQEQDTVGGGFDKEQALYGDISQLSIWDSELSSFDVAELAGCRSLGRGNVFNLNTASVEVAGDVQESTVDPGVFCRSLGDWDQDIIFPEVRTFPRIQTLCRLLNSSMSVPRSNEENERLFEELKPFLSACNPKTKWKLWLGITDEADEGAWVDIETQRPLEYTNFRPPFPNGGTLYSCGMMTDEGIWADSNCKAKRCGACQVMRSSILYLRGLCFETEHRTHFRWFGYAGGRPLFRGFYNYVIMWDEDKELWLLRHAETNETLAWLENTEGYPLGRHKWSSNGSLCDESLPNSLHLSLSLCTEEQFACASGHCLDNHSRCNLFHDCEDGSDEENCSVVGVRAGYQKHLPPRGHHDSPLEITPGITLTRISDVDGISMVINLEFLLLLTWRDERVSFRHLDRSTKTLIPKRDSEQLWRPRSQAMNLLAGEIKLLDETFTVGPASNATLPNFNSVERDLVYPGTHNDITLSTHSAAKFTCSFDLYFYPFDVQECSIDLHLLDDFEGSVRFAEGGGTASYTGPKDLALYTVRNVHLDSDDERNLLRLKFELQRRLGVILLSTFVPSVLLLSVSWATLFVKLEALNVRAIMSLTTLLVLYTLFSNLSSSVPHTAAIKLIDIWFFFIILLIFMNIMMHIFIEFVVLLPKKTHRVVPIHQSVLRAEKVMCFYRFFVFPPVFSIFNLVFWSIVFLDNKNQL